MVVPITRQNRRAITADHRVDAPNHAVDVAAPHRRRNRGLLGHRPRREDPRVEQVDLGACRPRHRLRRLSADVDDASDGTSVLHREVAGIQIDAAEHLGRQDRRPTEEVVEQRHLVTIDEHGRISRPRAAHEQYADDERCPRQPGQVLHHAARIAEGARHRPQDLALQRAPREARLHPTPAHDDLVRRSRQRLEPEFDRDLVARLEHRLDAVTAVVGRRRRHHVCSRREALERELPPRIGVGLRLGTDEHHPRGRDRRAGRLLAHATGNASIDRGRRRRRRGHLRLEPKRELDANRPRLPVELRRLELELPRRLERRLVEATANRRPSQHRLTHTTVGLDGQHDHDHCGARLTVGTLRIDRIDELRQHRRLRQNRRRCHLR